jgi:hypothetical protein
VLGAWLRDLLRLTNAKDASAAGSLAAMRGCGLPPLSDPFWRRSDLATQVLTVLSTLEKERALLVAQLHSVKSGLPSATAAPRLTPAQVRHQSSLAAAAARGAPVTTRAGGAAPGAAPGNTAAADKAAAETATALQRALDAEQARAREREAKLQAEIDAVMMAGIEALEAKNAFNAEADRAQKQARAQRGRDACGENSAVCVCRGRDRGGVALGAAAARAWRRRAARHARRRAVARAHARSAAPARATPPPQQTRIHTR